MEKSRFFFEYFLVDFGMAAVAGAQIGEEKDMNRRGFLKTLAIAAVAGPALLVEQRGVPRICCGTPRGRTMHCIVIDEYDSPADVRAELLRREPDRSIFATMLYGEIMVG